MASYPIIATGDCTFVTSTVRKLPAFYMEDYSILGLRVNNCDKAEQVLNQEGFSLDRKEDYLSITVEKTANLQKIVVLLNSCGVGCELADIADGMYQG
jgi:hypothetical protein